MDSMKSLNHSLPRPSPKLSKQTPTELLRTFKTAALEVTNLYKFAADGHEEGRRAGYHEAVSDLLSYLDKENFGAAAGEGWQIRQWAKDRIDGTTLATVSESDEERETEKRAESPPPVPRDSSPIQPRSPLRSETPNTRTSVAMNHSIPNLQPKSDTFSFRSNHPYPSDVDMQPREISPEDTRSSNIKPEIHSKPSRTVARSNKSSRTTSGRSSGGASKRKFPYGDYFDISSFGDGKDGSGHSSAKRGRMG
jgi:hypothetical protein